MPTTRLTFVAFVARHFVDGNPYLARCITTFLFDDVIKRHRARRYWTRLCKQWKVPRSFFQYDGGVHVFGSDCQLTMRTHERAEQEGGFLGECWLILCRSCLEPLYFYWHSKRRHLYYDITKRAEQTYCSPDWFQQCQDCEDENIKFLYTLDCESREDDEEYEKRTFEEFIRSGDAFDEYDYDQLLTNITDEKAEKMKAFIRDVYGIEESSEEESEDEDDDEDDDEDN